MDMKTVLILANGPWSNAKLLPNLAKKADYILAVNGAWAKLKSFNLNLKVDILIGDLDSLNRSQIEVPEKVEVKTHPRAKDKTDLELAIDEAKKLDPEKIVIFGALGGRIDHTFANILLLEKIAKWEIQGEIVDGNQRIYAVFPGDGLNLSTNVGDTISLIPITERVENVSTKGLEYSLRNEPLDRVPTRGISNVATSATVKVKISRGILLVTHQLKF